MVAARRNRRLLLPLPFGVTRHPKTVINRFEMAPPPGKARRGARGVNYQPLVGTERFSYRSGSKSRIYIILRSREVVKMTAEIQLLFEKKFTNKKPSKRGLKIIYSVSLQWTR